MLKFRTKTENGFDFRLNLSELQTIESRAGAQVHGAASAEDGLALFARFHPHVIVSDIAMPGEDGYNMIQKIRALGPAKGGNIPAVALTAYAGTEDVWRAMSAGFQAHLAKPVDAQDLAKALEILVKQPVSPIIPSN